MRAPIKNFLFAAVLICFGVTIKAASTLTIAGTWCDYAQSPLGIENPSPGLGWQLESAARNQTQTAYQVQVASSEELLASGRPDLWDSGKSISRQSVHVKYAGKPLSSRQRCYWRVRVWDKTDVATPFSAANVWEMGLLEQNDWVGQWVGYTAGWPGRALYFRYAFELEKPVLSARAYIAGIGYSELRLNGEKVGDQVLDPGWTDYTKRVLYVTHDVGSRLRAGSNVIGAIVGHGWHGAPKLRLQLEITFTDGSKKTIASRGAHTIARDLWYVTSGPIVEDSIYDGETYDARLEKTGWDMPAKRNPIGSGGRRERWQTVVPVGAPGGRMVAQTLEPIKVVETLQPTEIKEPSPGVYVLDAGRNIAGWARLRVQAPAGTKITLRFAESLRADGTVNDDNLRKAFATDVYIAKGAEMEEWEPRFTYHGFRYLQIEGWPGVPRPDNFQFRLVRSAVENNGVFDSSNGLLNRIQKMVRNTEANNLHSVPTDCPQRDERMGWLNDMTVRIEQALYNFRMGRFYAKWLDDVTDTQIEDGSITDTAPFKWGKRPADPVSASYLLLGWSIYEHYGDTGPMRKHYPAFSRWVDYLTSRAEDGIVSYSSWGDWAPPKAFAIPGSIGAGAISAGTPGPLMSTGYYYYQTKLLAKMARVLGDDTEAKRRAVMAEKIADAFNREFWNEAIGGYGSNNQACNSFALFLGLVPSKNVPRVVANLVSAVEQTNGHLSTGNLCTKYVLDMLAEHGHADLAYRIATKTEYPSWGFMLEKGATTLWERWEHLTGGSMNSHDHPMLGSVSSWFFKYLAGIRVDPSGPGFSRVLIQPAFVSGLDKAEGSYRSLSGVITSAWRREGGRIVLEVSVPVNTVATVRLPVRDPAQVTEKGLPLKNVNGVGGVSAEATAVAFQLGSGTYQFVVDANAPALGQVERNLPAVAALYGKGI